MLEVRTHDSIRDLPEATWDGLEGTSEAPFLRWAWLDVLERTGCVGGVSGWVPQHVSFWDAGQLVAAAPAYLKDNSEGEFVFDHGWASAARRAGIRYYPKLVFAVPFTPATAPKLLVRPGADRARLLRGLAEAMREIVRELGISSAHALFLPDADAAALERAGLAMRHGVQFHWRNAGYATFDDYLARFSSKRRNQIRRERRAVAESGVVVRTHRGDAITPPVVDAMFRFYLNTVEKFVWGRQYLNRAFFDELLCRMRAAIEIVVAYDGARPIAGAFNLASERALFGRYWGADDHRPFLHFEVCYYHPIEECIRRGVARFEPGAGGEHKVVRGFEPTLMHSAHHLADVRLDRAVREFLQGERDAYRELAANPDVAWRSSR